MYETGLWIRRPLPAFSGKGRGRYWNHKKFEEKYGLPFTLLSDTELSAIQAYDVWKEKNMYGKKTMGVVRTTYLIDEEGVIEKAFGKVKAVDNPKQMLELL